MGFHEAGEHREETLPGLSFHGTGPGLYQMPRGVEQHHRGAAIGQAEGRPGESPPPVEQHLDMLASLHRLDGREDEAPGRPEVVGGDVGDAHHAGRRQQSASGRPLMQGGLEAGVLLGRAAVLEEEDERLASEAGQPHRSTVRIPEDGLDALGLRRWHGAREKPGEGKGNGPGRRFSQTIDKH
jgi:hypothetical protein